MKSLKHTKEFSGEIIFKSVLHKTLLLTVLNYEGIFDGTEMSTSIGVNILRSQYAVHYSK